MRIVKVRDSSSSTSSDPSSPVSPTGPPSISARVESNKQLAHTEANYSKPVVVTLSSLSFTDPSKDTGSQPNGAADDGSKEPGLELFVRAGQDGESYGACPFCQRMFMILLYKASKENESGAGGRPPLRFTVTTVDLARPPIAFKKLVGNRVPALVHGEEVITDHEEMVQYIDSRWPLPSLRYNNQTAVEATLGAFSKFSFFVKDPSKSPAALVSELRKMDEYLRDEENEYLCGDALTHLDCLVLPKLQHILLVSRVFRDFQPPADLAHFWAYVARAYRTDAFERTVPSDQEIVASWAAKPGMPMLTKQQRKEYSTLATPRFTLEVPEGVELPPTDGEEAARAGGRRRRDDEESDDDDGYGDVQVSEGCGREEGGRGDGEEQDVARGEMSGGEEAGDCAREGQLVV